MKKKKGKKGKKVCYVVSAKDPTKSKLTCTLTPRFVKLNKILQKQYKKKRLTKYEIPTAVVMNHFQLTNVFFSAQGKEESLVDHFDVQPDSVYVVDGEVVRTNSGDTKTTRFKTGIVYDEKMLLHKDSSSGIPEVPARCEWIMKGLEEHGLLQRSITVKSRSATLDELKLCHSAKYVRKVMDGGFKGAFGDFYVCDNTGIAASIACGCVLQMVDEVMDGNVDNGFCVIRPPGHHCHEDRPQGFCFFSNVTIAAKYAKKKHNVGKVMIVDWDVHHGNGTQDLRMDDEDILFISTHRDFYPYTGFLDAIGKNGNTININFETKYGDPEILNAFYQVIMPVALEFQPELIIISAGYDAVAKDPLGGCRIEPETFGMLTSLLMSVTGGSKVIMALEGGYNLAAITKCVVECVRVLQGEQPTRLSGRSKEISNELGGSASIVLKQVLKKHSADWACFSHFKDLQIPEKVAQMPEWWVESKKKQRENEKRREEQAEEESKKIEEEKEKEAPEAKENEKEKEGEEEKEEKEIPDEKEKEKNGEEEKTPKEEIEKKVETDDANGSEAQKDPEEKEERPKTPDVEPSTET